MSVPRNENLTHEAVAITAGLHFASSSEEMNMAARLAALRDTVLVFGVGITNAHRSKKFLGPIPLNPRPRPAPPGLGFFFVVN
jgi:hypothetical protein